MGLVGHVHSCSVHSRSRRQNPFIERQPRRQVPQPPERLLLHVDDRPHLPRFVTLRSAAVVHEIVHSKNVNEVISRQEPKDPPDIAPFCCCGPVMIYARSVRTKHICDQQTHNARNLPGLDWCCHPHAPLYCVNIIYHYRGVFSMASSLLGNEPRSASRARLALVPVALRGHLLPRALRKVREKQTYGVV